MKLGFFGVLFIVFLVLAIMGKVSFWWILLPAIPLVLLVGFMFLVFMAILS
jgi:hypothetical protein